MFDDLLHVNGIDATTGRPLLPALAAGTVAKIARGEALTRDELAELEAKRRQAEGGEDTKTHGVVAGIEANDLSQAGWGIITAAEDAPALPAIREALAPLFALRQARAGDRYREYDGELAFFPGDSKNGWLGRAGGEPGPVDPARTPYYLLILASPEKIPFRFQYQLDVQYAVGRLWFDGPDALDRYAGYARTVVAAETGQLAGQPWSLPRKAAFFGVRNARDTATDLSAEYLVKPLAKYLAADQPSWQIATHMDEQADKLGLARLLGGDDTPALLFTASHGMSFPADHELQRRHQGALLCGDWPGPDRWHDPIPERFYFSADDVADNARLLGLIAFHFACYGAGTPRAGRVRAPGRDGTAGPDRAERLPGGPAAAPPGAPAGRRAGGHRARGPRLGLLIHLEWVRQPAHRVQEHAEMPGRRAARRPRHGILQRALR